METVRGVITKILRAGPTVYDKSFVLIEYENLAGDKLVEARLSGGIGDLGFGDYFLATGGWSTQTFQGEKQEVFHAGKIMPASPEAVHTAHRYLSLNFSKKYGITPKAIDDLVEKHGGSVIQVILESPDELINCSVNKKKYGKQIKDLLAKKLATKQAREILEDASFGERQIDKILTAFKSEAYEKIKKNPYDILSVPDIEFKHADRLGKRLGFTGEDERRLTGAAIDLIRTVEESGSSTVAAQHLAKAISDSIGIPEDSINAFLTDKANSKDRSGFTAIKFPDMDIVQALTQKHFQNELDAARKIVDIIASGRRNDPALVRRVCNEVLANTMLDEHQRNAVEVAVASPICVITGGPGTGKSTILKSVIEVSRKIEKAQILTTAPTGKAAANAAEITGDEGKTLQLLLGMRKDEKTGDNTYTLDADNMLPDNVVVIVDETSMMDNELLAALLRAMPLSGRLILQGDPNQLPSVGVGRVMADLIEMNIYGHSLLPVARLVNVYRQDKESRISECAEQINDGVSPELDASVKGGVTFRDCASKEITQRIVGIIKNLQDQGFDPLRDIAVISPQAPGAGGTWELNDALAKALNPGRKPIPGIEKNNGDDIRLPVPHVGDRVMVTENDKNTSVMNGDIGTIIGYQPNEKRPSRNDILVRLDDNRMLEVPETKWRNLILAYAITCHKSQGSQYPVVILPFSDMHKGMAERTLLYTGWTRAKKLVIGIGSKDIFNQFVTTHTANDRYTVLRKMAEVIAIQRKIKPLGLVAEYVPLLDPANSKPKRTGRPSAAPSRPRARVRVGKKSETTTPDPAPSVPASNADHKPAAANVRRKPNSRRKVIVAPVEKPKSEPVPVQSNEPAPASNVGVKIRRRGVVRLRDKNKPTNSM